MGGRGAAAMTWEDYEAWQKELERRFPRPKPTTYNVVTSDDVPLGANHAFFSGHNRAWSLVTYDVEESAEVRIWDRHTFKQDKPALRWVNGEQVVEVYIDGMSTEEFISETGLKFDLHKGGYVLSKRMSRALREYYVEHSFPSDSVKIAYLPEDDRRDKIWDGAGLISRRMVKRMNEETLRKLDEQIENEKDKENRKKLKQKRAKLERELTHATRIEFTALTEKGEDKGHALVAEELFDDDGNEVDFLLIEDTKKEVQLHNGETWVGINFVHGHPRMRLDIQSLIHLQEFFGTENLLKYTRQEGDLFVESLREGTAGAIMERIDKNETIEDVQNWHLREFIACGGDPRWSGSHIKTLAGQHLKRLNESTLENLRLPIPGGRYYMIPAGVGQRAGIDVSVPRGQIKIDQERGTAWISDDDWLEMEDSPKDPETGKGEGLASIWGGGDNDDALWIYQFTDKADGERKVLAWRSPNQLGEYAVLKPTDDTPELTWETTDGTISYPEADSRNLPLRTDHRPKIKSKIDPKSAGGVGEGEEYSIEVMEKVFDRARANAGAVGMYCNALMLHKALFGTLPPDAPAPLEDVIDASVKTGADLSIIKEWCVKNSENILLWGTAIPKVIQKRLSQERNLPPGTLVPPKLKSSGHWLDQLVGGVERHIEHIKAERDELQAQARPPQRLFDAAFDDPEAIEIGAKFNQAYGAIQNQIRKEKKLSPADTRQIEQQVEEEIKQFTAEERINQLRQIIYSEKFKEIAAKRANSLNPMTPEDNARAIALTDDTLAKLSPAEQAAKLYQHIENKRKWAAEQEKAQWTEQDHERVRKRMQRFLDRIPPDRHTAILRGAIVSTYMSDPPGSDAAVWLTGQQTANGRQPGIAQKTLQALREIGLLDEIDQNDNQGVITYPGAVIQEPTYQTAGIKSAWFTWYQNHARETGQPIPQEPREVPKTKQKWAKKQLQESARHLKGQEIEVREEENGILTAYTVNDARQLGRIDLTSSALEAGDMVTIQGAIARDGGLRLTVKP